ncbi:unnamed protein product [Rotaria sp. Silwood2]|nr:unnamed protein product [Rotaria sp. Silwood2]
MAELDVLLQTLHNIPIQNKCFGNNRITGSQINQNDIIELLTIKASQSQIFNLAKVKKKKNYGRLVKRLKHKFKLANVVLQKSDKSKVFHLGKLEDYRNKSKEYMEKTQAYKCLGSEDPLPDLIISTNKYLLDLRLAKWITQTQYEKLCINPCEVELAHLYYLPKAHKPGTPLRPIISGLKHPTIKISKFLDDLLRPLFDKMAQDTTVTSGFELLKKLKEWCTLNMNQNTIFCTIDVLDLYTMIPQVEGVLSLKKMFDYLKLKKVGSLRAETIIRLGRFVMQNNYFSYDGQFYRQIRGGAMGRNDYVGRNNNNYYREGNLFYNRNYQRYTGNFYNRNYRNRNYRIPRPDSNLYHRGGYGFVSPGQERQERSPSRCRLSNRLRRQGPRQIRLNDFMPTELRESSPNLPPDFNIATATALAIASTNIPSDALPQRERFVQNNTTQPFTVTGNNQNKQQRQQQNQRQRKTTSSFRCRQRRNNRFVMLADENDNNLSDVEAELEDHSRNSKNALSGRGNQAYNWSTKNKNYQILAKRVELDLPPKMIEKFDFSFKLDESIINQDEAQATYNQTRQITKHFRTQAMTLYVQSAARENEVLSNEIKGIIDRFPQDNDDGFDAEPGYAAFKQYHEIPSRGRYQQSANSRTNNRSDYNTFAGRGFLAPAIINEANIQLNEEEHQLLKLGPKFIFNNPKTAARQRIIELATLKRKIENCFLYKKVSPGRPLHQFIAELDVLLQTLHNVPTVDKYLDKNKNAIFSNDINQNKGIIEIINSQLSQSQFMSTCKMKKKKNYGRLVKRLKHKFKLANVVLQKSAKSKVFHLGTLENYRKKSEEYMAKTQAYKCLGIDDPLPDLITKTNKYLLNLRLAKWITQKQYEK